MSGPASIWRHTRNVFNLLLPPACALCLERLDPPDPDLFCQNCINQIPGLKRNRCPRCALPYPAEEGAGHLCKTCLQEKKHLFTGVTAIGPYSDLLREAIHRFKYRNEINLDRPLATMLGNTLLREEIKSTLLVPVPLHKNKIRQRSYNQAALLATKISRHIGVPVAANLLTREIPGPPQQGLSATARARNIKDAFALHGRIDGEAVLLLDDVMTTGATVRECARTLLAGGADAVHVAVLARAPLR